MPVRLHLFDLGIVALYLIAITLFGLRFARRGTARDKSLRGYFLADRSVPWWAIALSIVSAETSTLTIIGTPGLAFAGDFGFLQIVIGYMLGRIVVALLFLPKYFHGEMLTAYQLIDRRFGRTLYKVTAGLFLLTRAAAEGVRVFAVSIVVAIAIGTGDVLSIAIISALTLLYTFEGGMAAVIWTDVVQMAIYIGGTFVAIWSLGQHVPGGWPHIHAIAAAAGKFHMLNFAFNLTTTYTFWAGVLGGTFLTMASHGTDQLMVQRMLAAKNLRQSQLALLSSGVVIFIQFALFLLIGAGLFVFYSMPGAPHLASEMWAGDTNRIFPAFIVQEMPTGVAGLLVAAILAAAMSNLSAALNSLSSTTVVDFYMGFRPTAADSERMIVSRLSTVLWALVLFAVAVYAVHAGGKGNVVEIGLSIASVAYGCLLGVFLLGTLTRYATQMGAIIGMITGFALNLWLWQGSFPKYWIISNVGTARCKSPGDAACYVRAFAIPHIAWTWYVLIGALVTFAVGSLASLVFRKQSPRTKSAIIAASLLLVILSAASRPCNAQSKDPDSARPVTTASTISTSNSTTRAAPATTRPSAPASLKGMASAMPYQLALENPALAAEVTSPSAPLLVASSSAAPPPAQTPAPSTPTTPDFSAASAAIDTAIAQKKLPGAVLLVGHDGKVVFEQAYGVRKYADEPGLDGKPSPAEPMTLDTIFDMASLTKCLVTATAIMQLYEAHKLDFDDPVAKYLPEFAANGKQNVTIRELLTHYSGLPPDVNLKDDWGLAAPDKAEGLRRAMESPLTTTPGTHFEYSDINFITLGAIVEKLSGEPLDVYAQQHIFTPLGMTQTRYLPIEKACGYADSVPPYSVSARTKEVIKQGPPGMKIELECDKERGWMAYPLLRQIAPTQHDDQGTKETNPYFDVLLRGTVHDPTTRRMGGVAGHAGVFSTAEDVSKFAQALLDKLLYNTGPFPLKQSTLKLMTTPEQPPTALGGATIFTPDGKTTTGIALRGFGWDINSAYSRPRGSIFPTQMSPNEKPLVPPSFGHTGFTGTSLWMDPSSDTYIVLLANSVHPRGASPISPLRGEVATDVAKALGLSLTAPATPAPSADRKGMASAMPQDDALTAPATRAPSADRKGMASAVPQSATKDRAALAAEVTSPQPQDPPPYVCPPTAMCDPTISSEPPTFPIAQTSSTGLVQSLQAPPPPASLKGTALAAERMPSQPLDPRTSDLEPTLTGLDVLESTNFAPLKALAAKHNNHLRIGLLTNQTGLDSHGRRTIDILRTADPEIELVRLFSPEHGIFGAKDAEVIGQETDPASGLQVTSLYGPKDADKRPKPEDLKDLNAVVIDLQDAGVRFYTYETVLGYFLGAAACEVARNHPLEIIVLDRPALIGGLAVQGPVSDTAASYIDFSPEPVRNGMTLGELAEYFQGDWITYCNSISAIRRSANTREASASHSSDGLVVRGFSPGSQAVRFPVSEGAFAPSLLLVAAAQTSPTGSFQGTGAERVAAHLTVIPLQNWRRSEFFDQTGLTWVNPSPNLRSVEAATLYPGLGMLDFANISVGRGTATPFEVFGAGATAATKDAPAIPAWFDGKAVAAYLTARHIPGVSFAATTFPVADDANHYPYHGQTIEGVRLTVTDRVALDSPELGIEILSALHHLYPAQFKLEKAAALVANTETMAALARGDDPRAIAASWAPALAEFRARRAKYLLYP